MAASAYASTWTLVGSFVGMALVNAILPNPKPTSPQQAQALAAPSPTYNLGAQGNTARLEAAIPEHFGRHIAFPDFAAQPYAEYAGNEQYLYQLFCLGRGQYDVESLWIEDTPINSFNEVQYEILQPGSSPTLFPTNVLTSLEVAGQTLTTGAYVGGFIVNPAGTLCNAIGVDFVMPRGLFYAEDSGALSAVSVSLQVEARTVDAAGAPTSSYVALTGVSYTAWSDWTNAPSLGTSTALIEYETRSETQLVQGEGELISNYVTYYVVRTRSLLGSGVFTAATTTAQRYSIRLPVTPGRYQVRVVRMDTEQTDTRYGHEAVWAGLRTYMTGTTDFGDVTLIAMRIRASNNLSQQASRKFNVIATRKLPVWNGTSFSANTTTRSIAWPLVYAAKQCGLTDAQIDLAALLTLDGIWAARGDYFDGRFDNFLGFWEAASQIAQAGRAKVFMQGGVLRVARDQAATIPVALYSMRNIVRGSFSVDYLMPTPETADAVDVGYFSAENWKPARVQAKLVGSAALKPAKVDQFGVTGRDHAFREGMYLAATNRYRRRMITFQTEMEGFIPSFGDLIAIQHDMPGWGQGGEVVSVQAGAENRLVHSEELDNAAWTKFNATVTANTVLTPGGKGADKLVENTANSTHYASRTTAFSFAAGDTIAFSALVKAAERSVLQFRIFAGGAVVSTCLITVDLSVNTAVPLSNPLFYTIEDEGDGWRRLRMKVLADQAGAVTAALLLCTAGGANTYLGDGVSGMYFCEIQIAKDADNLLSLPAQFDDASWTGSATHTANTTLAPNNSTLADTITDSSSVAFQQKGKTVGVPNDLLTRYFHIYVFKTTGATSPTFGVNLNYSGGSVAVSVNLRLNTDTGVVSGASADATLVGGYWRLSGQITNNGSGHTTLVTNIYPATAAFGSFADVVTATGSAIVWGARLVVAETWGPYVPTTTSSISGATVLGLSEPVTFSPSGNHYIAVRERDGGLDGPHLVTPGATPSDVVLSTTFPAFTPYTGSAEERSHFTFGVAETYRQPARLISAKSVSEHLVEITCVNEDSNVHTAETGATTPSLITSSLANYQNAPRITGLIARPAQFGQNRHIASWQPSAWADRYAVEQSSDGGLTWQRLATTNQSNHTFEMLSPKTQVRVAALGLAQGAWEVLDLSIALPADVLDFTIDGNSLNWRANQSVNLKGYELRQNYGQNVDWNAATKINDGYVTLVPYALPLTYGGVRTLLVKAVDIFGQTSKNAAVVVVDLGDVAPLNVVETYDFDALSYPGTITGGALSGGDVLATSTTSFYEIDPLAPMYPANVNEPMYALGYYEALEYVTSVVTLQGALAGSTMLLNLSTAGVGLSVEYRQSAPSPMYISDSSSPMYTVNSSDPMYDASGPWLSWPGQLSASNTGYQFRVGLGGGATQARINMMALVVDAPDIEEFVDNLTLAFGGSVITYTKPFTVIKSITASLQAAASGAVGLDVNKSNNLVPTARALDQAGSNVAGASADFRLKGY
jgi:hypothetical protein